MNFSLYIIPKHLVIFDFKADMCLANFNFLSTTTPRKRAFDFCSIFVLFITTSMFSKLLFHEKSMHLVLEQVR